MANLNYRWDDDSSIEEMLNQFELRDNTGKLKYNRLLLKPIRIQEKIYLFDQFIALGGRSKKINLIQNMAYVRCINYME